MTTAIVGTLSSIAIPNYVNQLTATRQNECLAVMSQMITSTVGFNDEFSEYPMSWSDLNSMSAIMKDSGTAANDNHFNQISVAKGTHFMTASASGDIYNFECTPKEKNLEAYNVLGCLNLNNGASEIKRGTTKAKATEVNCE
ncbi:pilin [bacterium]|nr:pilin [bacterium]